MEPIGPQKTKS
jgi:hypothetical protein